MTSPDQVERCDDGLVCETHPEKAWPHDDCAGPGMLCPPLQRREDYWLAHSQHLRSELSRLHGERALAHEALNDGAEVASNDNPERELRDLTLVERIQSVMKSWDDECADKEAAQLRADLAESRLSLVQEYAQHRVDCDLSRIAQGVPSRLRPWRNVCTCGLSRLIESLSSAATTEKK